MRPSHPCFVMTAFVSQGQQLTLIDFLLYVVCIILFFKKCDAS